MKKLFILCLSLFAFVATQAQVSATSAMTAASGSVDSSATEYVTARVTSPGALALQVVVTKVANTGTTVAGYCILQGSLDGTNFVNVTSCKNTNYLSTPGNVYATDTFTLTNTTAAQTKCWVLHGCSQGGDDHPFVYYRVAVVMTTTKVTATGTYLLRKY